MPLLGALSLLISCVLSLLCLLSAFSLTDFSTHLTEKESSTSTMALVHGNPRIILPGHSSLFWVKTVAIVDPGSVLIVHPSLVIPLKTQDNAQLLNRSIQVTSVPGSQPHCYRQAANWQHNLFQHVSPERQSSSGVSQRMHPFPKCPQPALAY